MEISPESYARFTAFRQLVYRCSEQLTHNDLHALVYIWMYSDKEKYKNASSIVILSKLEATGKFGPWNPEGLLEMMREIKRNDLCNEVKDFIKMKWLKAVKKGTRRIVHTNDEDLQATFEVVVAQATVLMQQISAFEKALSEEECAREKAHDLIVGAAQTAQTLSERLLRAQNELYTTDNDQYVDLDNYRKPRVRSSSLDTTSDRKSTCLPPTTSRTPTHTAYTKINHAQTIPTESELGEYVDMSTLKSKKRLAPVGIRIAPADFNTTEYVDMSSLKKNNNAPSSETMNSLLLSDCYADQSKSSKGPITVALSSAVAVSCASSQSVPTPLETSPRSEHSVPTSSAENSRHDSLDVLEPPNPPPMEPCYPPPPMGPPPMELPYPPMPGGELYCNLEEMQAQVLKLKSNESFDAVDTDTAQTNSTPAPPPEPLYIEPMPPEPTYIDASTLVTPPVTTSTPAKPPEATNSAVPPEATARVGPPEALYSNLSSLNLSSILQSLPPRDIQRMLQTSVSLPETSVPTPPERNDSLSSAEEVPLTSSQNFSDDVSPKQQESNASSPTPTNRPVTAPKPTIKPKPDILARRSSLGHTTHMRVRAKAVSRSLKCTSVLNTVKNSVLTEQKEVDSVSFDKESKTKGISEATGNYYTQLQLPQQQGISDGSYAVIQYH